MGATFGSTTDGRVASMARRQALAQGKAALPAPVERLRSGFRAAALPPPAGKASAGPLPVTTAASAEASAVASPSKGGTAPGAPVPMQAAAIPGVPAEASASLVGRIQSMMRRKLMSEGKAALQAASAARVAPVAAASPSPAVEEDAATRVRPPVDSGSCREMARARRALLSQRGRGEAASAPPSRPPRLGSLQYAPKVVASETQGGQQVTGLRIGSGVQVTGIEAGAMLPVSGTAYIGATDAPARSGGPKVGLARTAGGLTVSGTLVRSRVAITGDEAGASVVVTGEADQRLDDDLTPRRESGADTAAQFSRQADPHGRSVFGLNLGGSPASPGSRLRSRAPAIEVTQGGRTISGSAVGRSARVTGDEQGACRAITGDQYLSPAARNSECGGRGGGTAPAPHLAEARRDPVTGAKVAVSPTWGGQRVTGADVEHRPPVTGDEPGSCAVITGTPYQGPATLHGWCDPGEAVAAEQRLPQQPASAGVTGDAPRPDGSVTGTERGATRPITGTPYWRAQANVQPSEDALVRIDRSFSVPSPQRSAQLRADRSVAELPSASARITGAFALSQDKITGNVEFQFKPRQAADGAGARSCITGEGRTQGFVITGDAWADNVNVTGTEGYIAAERNPSQSAGKPHGWAGTGPFKAKGKHEEPRQIVTGMVGWTAKSAAKVTLSGGAQG